MIYVFLAEGFEEIEALAPVDVLRRGGIEVKTVGVGAKVIEGSHGIRVECDIQENEASTENLKAVILPGGMPGTINLEKSETVQKFIDFAAEEKVLSFFDKFARTRSGYSLYDSAEIYNFLTRDMKMLSAFSDFVLSDRFLNLNMNEDFKFTANATYVEKEDYLEINFESELSKEEISELLKALRLKEDYYRTRDGKYLDFKTSDKREIFELFVNLGITEKEIKAGKIKIPKFELLRIEAMSAITKDAGFKKYLDNIRNHKPVIPADLCGELRSYQVDALSWFYELSELGMGGILADDMGLGKTLQILAFLYTEKPEKAYRIPPNRAASDVLVNLLIYIAPVNAAQANFKISKGPIK